MVRRRLAQLLHRLATWIQPSPSVAKPNYAMPKPHLATSATEGVSKATPLRLPVYRRRTYAEEQAEWEWQHNKKAQEQLAREKAGFF